ncbi:MAG: hypothetical protein GYA51_18745 [Candidatus Methanofastidiosa archaeon]|nr:hypothetical protein [Candidatus Methanofastidiosa archaeon]
MITVKKIGDRIIKDIKAFPEDAKQCSGEDSPKTVWDEYKEQVQYEEYDSFEVLERTLSSMVADSINELSPDEIWTLYSSIYDNPESEDYYEMMKGLKYELFSYIHDKAESEEIEYTDSAPRYFWYYLDPHDFPIEEIIDYNLVAICEVIKRVSPYEHLIHAFSNFTGPIGEHGVVNLSSFEEENGLEEITFEKFEGIKKCFFAKPVAKKSETLSGQENKSKANPQDAKEIQSFDQRQPTNIKEIVSRFDEYTDYMRKHPKKARVSMDFLEQYVMNYFDKATPDEMELKKMAVDIVDELYLRIADIVRRDIHTNAFFGIIVNRLFFELAKRNILVFYILDNHLRDDRFKVAVELFGVCHFNTIHPYRVERLGFGNGYTQLPSKEYRAIEKEIDDAVAQNKHICYIEKDSSVNYIKNVLTLAELCQYEYLIVFRNQPPDSEKRATWLTGSFRGLID